MDAQEYKPTLLIVWNLQKKVSFYYDDIKLEPSGMY